MYEVKVNPELFIEEEIPELHPRSPLFKEYWRTQKERCILGYWQSGVWMPGKLYFYVNFGTIKLNKGEQRGVKQFGRPWLRDLEWEFFYNWDEARGFSGFQLDEEYTCHRAVKPMDAHSTQEPLSDEEIIRFYCMENGEILEEAYHNIFKGPIIPLGTDKRRERKTYISAKEYMRKQHDGNLGEPLYYNQAKNFMMLGSRGFGKSYSVGHVILHEWLFDGLLKYDRNDPTKYKTSSEIVVGAGDAKYSADLLEKTRLSLERLPGGFNGPTRVYPAPFFKNYTGSWQPAKQITARYKKRVDGGNWIWAGTKSNIKHRTFKDNPFAANGTRPGVMVFEECGMFDNLIDSYNASVECMRDGAWKFGSAVFLGTGGDFQGGGTRDAYDIFYNPDKYDCITFVDEWEGKGSHGKVCYFVPAYVGLNDFKDTWGNTDTEAAKKELEGVRAKLQGSGGLSKALDSEIQNRPIVPSEMFLAKTGNIFPVAELKNRLNSLERDSMFLALEKPVELYFDSEEKYGVGFRIDMKRKHPVINEFPWDDRADREGSVVIFEEPIYDEFGKIPKDLYVIGHDPVRTDDPDGGSLASIYVLKTNKYWQKYGHNEIVANFIGRPYIGREKTNEILLKLSMLYGNAKIFFENSVGNVKEYFEKNKALHLLAKTPTTIFSKKASYEHGRIISYGYPMSSRKVKMDGLQYIRDWLVEERGQENGVKIRNLDRIWDRGLLQEMVAFDIDHGNYDRVMGFMGCVFGLAEMFNKYKEDVEENVLTDESLQFLTHNRRLFRSVGPVLTSTEEESYISEREKTEDMALFLGSIASSI